MFVESCAPYAISLLIYLGPPGSKGSVAHLHAFYLIVVETQVRVFLQHSTILGRSYLIEGRSSLRCSSFNESPTGLH